MNLFCWYYPAIPKYGEGDGEKDESTSEKTKSATNQTQGCLCGYLHKTVRVIFWIWCWTVWMQSTLWASDSMLYQPSFPFQSHQMWRCSGRSSQSEHCKAARSLEFRLLIFLKLTFHLHFCCRCWTEYSDQTLFCSFDKPLLLWQAYVWRCDYMGNKNEELFDILVVIDGVAVLIVQYVCV